MLFVVFPVPSADSAVQLLAGSMVVPVVLRLATSLSELAELAGWEVSEASSGQERLWSLSRGDGDAAVLRQGGVGISASPP